MWWKIFSIVIGLLILAINGVPNVHASCGSSSCFLNIGNQPAIQPKDVVRLDVNYSYLPQTSPENRVAAVNIEKQEIILDEHQEFQTINQQLQMTLNYGVTDNITFQVTLPVIFRDHDHRIEVGVDAATPTGEFENFDAAGLGDIRLMGKYGFLPSLRSLIVVGVGVDFPTGEFEARNSEGDIQEPTLQIGRGDYGVVGQIFQSYELIPHKLNQFLSYSYQHTFENKFQYQFGDRHTVNAGLIYQLTSKIALSGQVNFRYAGRDRFAAKLEQAGGGSLPFGEFVIDNRVLDRTVPNTGETTVMFTPGINLNLDDQTSWYFFSQVPLSRDSDGGLEPGVSFLTGFVHYFSFSDSST